MPTRARIVINFVLFQVGWFAAVLGGAHDRVWLGTSIALLVVAIHLYSAIRPQEELQLILLVTVIGLAWDSALVSFKVIAYPHGTLVQGFAPVWILAVWALFATTFNVSLGWMKHRYPIASAFGAMGAPLSFLAGARMQALTFPDIVTALGALAIGWGVMMPIMMRLAQRFDGVRTVPSGSASTPA